MELQNKYFCFYQILEIGRGPRSENAKYKQNIFCGLRHHKQINNDVGARRVVVYISFRKSLK